MAIRKNNAQVAIVKETGDGVYTAPSASNLVLVQDVEYTVDGDSFERSELCGNFNKPDPIVGPASATVKFTWLGKGSGSAGVAPEIGAALLGCGFNQTTTSGVSVAYNAVARFDGSSAAGTVYPGPSYSVVLLEDGWCYPVKGCWGNVDVECSVGEPVKLTFEFKGAFVQPTASGLFAGPSFNATVPPTFLTAGVTIPKASGSYNAPVFTSLKYSAGNSVELRKNANDAAGIMGAMVVDRRPTVSIDPEAVDQSTWDMFAAWRQGASGSVSTAVLGSAPGNRIQVLAPRCVIKKPAFADRNGLRTINLDFDVVSLPT
ncbi:MAG: hypothetical protein ABFD84_01115, partial [Candidatus Polarisedimenticolia bacterium]